jgi:RNA polymerase sigma-70 factor (ECF subfamily)
LAIRADDVDLGRDRLLVERFQAGDVAGFEDLYRRYYQRLFRFCLKRVGDAQEAEEVTQEAFTRAYAAMPRLAGERRFYPWLSVIASRLCSDTHRRRARAEVRAEVDSGMVDGGQDQVFAEVDRKLIHHALDRLGPRHREVLRLREEKGWSYQRIAEHFDVSLGAVEQLLWRARRALRREFETVTGSDARLAAGVPALGWLARRVHAFRARIDDLAAQAAPALANTAVAAALIVGGAATLPGGAHPSAPVTPPMPRITTTETTGTSATPAVDLPGGQAGAITSADPRAASSNAAIADEAPLVGFSNERQDNPEQRVESPLLGVDANVNQATGKVAGYVQQLGGGTP